ncbi:uncharacterized protein LOC136043882 isoform X3 [Artemia franciscana]|uniref:uncharacterized protein LOC136043882 isoform X3 n=1 Tax=Artemia franciscana TaxID=6661 RepID=UPI0032DB2A7B
MDRLVLLLTLFVVLIYTEKIVADNLALLSGTLRTFQTAACEGQDLDLRCPTGTVVNIQVAQHVRVSSDVFVCASHFSNPRRNYENCQLTSNMQHALLSSVVAACSKQRMCKIVPSMSQLGEPDSCPSNMVFTEVAFKCRPSEFKNKIACENETLVLRCKNNERLAIYSANFGRTKPETIHCPQTPGVPEEECQASYATETVMEFCHGKRHCSLTSSTAIFGSPCHPKSHNYLRIVYTCVSGKVLSDKYLGKSFEGDSGGNTAEELDHTVIKDPYKPVLPTVQSTQQFQASGMYDNAFSRDEEFPKQVFTEQPNEQNQLHRNWIADDMQDDLPSNFKEGNTGKDTGALDVIPIISGWIKTTSTIKENHEKFVLYLSLGVAFGVVLFLGLLIGRFWHKRRLSEESKKSESSQNHNTLSTDLSLPGFNDDLLDVDNDIDLTLVPPPSSQDLTSFSPNISTLQRQQFSQPRSFARTSNSHLFYG